MIELKPVIELANLSAKPYLNDSAGYRQARTALLAEEIELRRHIKLVARHWRQLPPGGEAPAYAFLDDQGKTVGLIDLFARHDTLVTYFWMYGPERERPCPMCTSLLGSLDIPAVDLEQRVALAVIGRSPVARQIAFARERGWSNLKFYQCVGDDFAKDYRGLAPDGSEWPALDVWKKDGNYGAPFLGRGVGADRRPRRGRARGTRADPAVDHSRSDTGRPGRGLVSETGI